MNARRDEGFTLLEVLIAVGLLGMVFAVVSAAFVISLESTTDSNGVQQKSQGAAFTSAYFNRDVQSAETISAAAVAPCGAPAGSLVASMAWDDVDDGGQGAHYVLRDATEDGPKWLVRLRCGSSEDVLGKGLTGATLATTAPTCPPGTDACLTLTGPIGDPHTISSTRRLP